MKKLYSLILLLVSGILLMTSCAKEEPVPTFDGQWKLVSADVVNYNNNHQVTGHFSIPISQFAQKDKLQIEFKDGKIITMVSASGEAVITSLFYRMEGSTLLVKSTANGPENVYGYYTLTNTDLSITTLDVSADGEISTKLVYNRK